MPEKNVNGNDRQWQEDVRKWRVNHFARAKSTGSFPELLRELADSIEQLGEVEVLDILLTTEIDQEGVKAVGTVYFTFPAD